MESHGFVTVFFILVLIIQTYARFSKDSGCGVSKGCFSNCRSYDGCTYLISWVQTSTGVDFTLKGDLKTSDAQYISFGLSSDEKMGEDSVTECIMNGGTFTLQNSYNPDDDNNNLVTNPTLGLSNSAGSYVNGILECSVRRTNTSTDPQIFSLLTDWYLFWAIGEYEDAEKEEHETYGISERKVDLQSFDDVSEKKNPKVKVHGCFTIIAWIGFCSVGVVLARYYKPMWVNKKLFGTVVWLQLHRALLIAAALLNLIAVIVIFSGHFEIYGSGFQNAHPVLGMIVTVVSVLNCIGGFLRPDPKHRYRPYFNWAHLALGLLSYILGVFTIGIGVSIEKSYVPFEVVYVVVVFVVYQICIEVVLEIIDRKGRQIQTKTGSDTNRQMSSISGSKVKLELQENVATSSPPSDNSSGHYCGRLKNWILGIHIGIITAFTLSIVIVVAVS